MPDWAVSLITVLTGAAGLAAGYALGYRNGSVCGELKALQTTISQMRSRRNHRHRHRTEEPEAAMRTE